MVATAREKLRPEFFERMYQGWEKDMIDRSGMLCLTENRGDILMWSHYARSHAGVCLEFEHVVGKGPIGAAIPIQYADAFPNFSFVRTFLDVHGPEETRDALVNFGKVIFLTKSAHWSYEKEWRVIDFSLDGQPRFGLRGFDAEALKGVILGCRMQAQQKKEVREASRARRPPPAIYEAVKKDFAFELNIRRVE